MPLNGFLSTTSVSVCRFDFRLRAIWISVSKNKSSFPANGLFARRAPLAAVWMQPNDSVHHETMRLVSLSLRFRRRMAAVLSMQSTVAQASCLWGIGLLARGYGIQQARRLLAPEARCLCY